MKQQETMTKKIVKKFNNALEVIPRALSMEGGKSSRSRSRSKASHSGRSKASSRRAPSTTAKLTAVSKKTAARGGKRRSVKRIRTRKSGGRSQGVAARAA